MINTSMSLTSSIPPRFSGLNQSTNPKLQGAEPGDTVFIRVPHPDGDDSIVIKIAQLVSVEGHQGELLGKNQVPAEATHDHVDKVTISSSKEGKQQFLTGTYMLGEEEKSLGDPIDHFTSTNPTKIKPTTKLLLGAPQLIAEIKKREMTLPTVAKPSKGALQLIAGIEPNRSSAYLDTLKAREPEK